MIELDLKNRPILVLTYGGKLSEMELQSLKKQSEYAFNGNRVVILEDGLKLDAVLINNLIATDGY
jgi:hypothetical protein